MKKAALFLALISLLSGRAMADIVTEGEFDIRFEVINLDEFPDYEFFFDFQTYYYEYGYQKGEIKQIDIEPGTNYVADERGGQTYLQARSLSAEFDDAKAEAPVGGVTYDSDEDISTITQLVRITKVEDGVIHFEIVNTIYEYIDGAIRKLDGDIDVFGGGLSGGNRWMLYALLPAIALLSILMLIFMRRKRPQIAHDAGPA